MVASPISKLLFEAGLGRTALTRQRDQEKKMIIGHIYVFNGIEPKRTKKNTKFVCHKTDRNKKKMRTINSGRFA